MTTLQTKSELRKVLEWKARRVGYEPCSDDTDDDLRQIYNYRTCDKVAV